MWIMSMKTRLRSPQERMDAFKKRFPKATEHGVGLCSMKRCTQPFLLASGLSADEAQLDRETWGPMLQEVIIDSPVVGVQ
jgi:hypothetical protein